MGETSYEENIANRLRNRLDGTFLDKAAADVIDALLVRLSPTEKPLMCRDPSCQINGPHELHDDPEVEMTAAFLAGAKFAWERRGDAQGHWDFEKGAQKYVENVLRIAKEDADAKRIDNSQFGVGA